MVSLKSLQEHADNYLKLGYARFLPRPFKLLFTIMHSLDVMKCHVIGYRRGLD
jgi:hypothetical protein